MPSENIITFLFDDVATDKRNPFPGQIFNEPSANEPGVDVYAGVQKDYTGDLVNVDLFFAVLTGNSSHPNATRVLRSTSADRVFIYFADHGGTGVIMFPSELLYASDLLPVLEDMHTRGLYSELVFYLESCESGSIFAGLLPAEWNIYAVTAANTEQSSWASYCPPDDIVDGVEIGSCLGDLFSTNWMENSEADGPTETLQAQYESVMNETVRSTVMQYGQLSFTEEETGDFIGSGDQTGPSWPHLTRTTRATKRQHDRVRAPQASQVSSRDVGMHLAYYRYLRAAPFSEESTAALSALRAELTAREMAEQRFTLLSDLIAQDRRHGPHVRRSASSLFSPPPMPIHSGLCVKTAVSELNRLGCAYDDFSLQFHRVIVNACRRYHTEEEGAEALRDAIRKVCE